MALPVLFDKAFKTRNRLIAATGMLLAAALPFVAGLTGLALLDSLFQGGPVPAAWDGTVTAAAFILAAWLPWQAGNLLGLSGNRGLRLALIRKITSERPADLRDTGRFVGFSPGDQLRTWDGETDCDVGFLTILPEALLYVGDQYAWTLRREHVDRVELSPQTAGIRRVVIRWHAPREPGRSFTIEARDGATMRRVNAVTMSLAEELTRWSAAEGVDGADVPHYGNPPTDAPGALTVDGPAPGSCAATLCIATIATVTIWRVAGDFIRAREYFHGILWSGLITVLAAGLTFHVLNYLQSWGATLPKKPKAPPPGAPFA